MAIEKGSKLPGVEQLIVVEGNSDDKTHETAQNALNELPINLKFILLQQKNRGKWDAVKLGIENSTHAVISIWDADLTVSPKEQKKSMKYFSIRPMMLR